MLGINIGNSSFNCFGDLILQDKIIRAAISDRCADEFRNLLTEMVNEGKTNGYYFGSNIACCNWLVSLILSLLCKHDKLAVYYEVQSNLSGNSEKFPYARYALLVSCLNNDDETAEYIIRNELDASDFKADWFFVNPLYFLMITGKYRLLEIALDICREKRKAELELFSENNFEHCINSEFDSDSMSFVAASAAYFGDRRFLTLLFDKGYRIDESMAAQLYNEPQAMKFMLEIFCNKPMDIRQFIRENFSTHNKLQLGWALFPLYGQEVLEQFLEEIGPMEKVHTIDSDIIMQYCAFDWTSADKLDRLLNGLLEKELTLRVGAYDIWEYAFLEEYIEPYSDTITLDLTYCDSDCFMDLNDDVLKRILMNKIIFSPKGGMIFVRIVLDRDNSQLTRLLINNGLVNKDNFYEILDYAISNKYLNVLGELHKFELNAENQ